MSGVFTPDDIGFPQAGESPESNIFQVADGGRDYPKPPHAEKLLLRFTFCRRAALTAWASGGSFGQIRRRQNGHTLVYWLI